MTTQFERTDRGVIDSRSQHNIRLALKKLRARVSYDLFHDRALVEGLDGFDALTDKALVRLRLLIDEKFDFLPSKDFFCDVVEDFAYRDNFHPVREYLDGLKWDKAKRIDTWLIDYAGAKDTKYVRAVGKLMLVAAVRRVRDPGCKFDEMPVLESDQGVAEKSSALRILAVDPDWFSDDFPLYADTKRVIESLRGYWIVEAAELSGMKKADVDHVKAVLSRQVDRARMAYDRGITEHKRQCIFVASTNNAQYLRDQTGNRRFWPVAIDEFDLTKLKRDRDQLWAEAAVCEAKGASIRLERSLWGDAAIEQQQRTIDDPWLDTFAHHLGDLRGKLLIEDAWSMIKLPEGQRTQEHNNRLGIVMRKLGFERKQKRVVGFANPKWCYVRGIGPRIEVRNYDGEIKVRHV